MVMIGTVNIRINGCQGSIRAFTTMVSRNKIAGGHSLARKWSKQ